MACDQEPNLCSYWDLVGNDMLSEVMKKLPVESLGRSRCVCKRWRSLVSSACFIKLQNRSFSSRTPPNLKAYIRMNSSEDETQFAVYQVQSGIKRQLQFPFRFLDDPPLTSFRFIDSINGVICVSYSMGSGLDSTIIWNPAIHRYILVPRLHCPLGDLATADMGEKSKFVLRFWCSTMGFGYNKSSINEFKVVRIWLPSWGTMSTPPPKCEVYSTLGGAWRSLSSSLNDALGSRQWGGGDEIRSGGRSSFVNGAVHWLLSRNDFRPDCLVLMFDCEREAFATMDLPREITERMKGERADPDPDDMTRTPTIVEFGGKLAAVFLSGFESSTMHWCVEMWVMQEHGVVSSWQKLHRVGDTLTSSGLVVSSFLSAEADPEHQPVHVVERHYQIFNDNLHEESLFLLDHHKARSYTHDHIVNIRVPQEFSKQSTDISSTL